MELAIIELEKYRIASITRTERTEGEQNVNITITCRKALRELGIKELKRRAGVASGNKRRTEREQTPASAYASASLGNGEYEGKGVKIPSWTEWWGVCQIVGIPEWKAKDEFNKQTAKDDPWHGARGSLPHHAARLKAWWEADGKPMTPPKSKSSQQRTQQPENQI